MNSDRPFGRQHLDRTPLLGPNDPNAACFLTLAAATSCNVSVPEREEVLDRLPVPCALRRDGRTADHSAAFNPNGRFSFPIFFPGLLFAWSPACAPPAEESCNQPDALAEQADRSEWLLLSPEEEAGIVRLSVGPDEPILCTATLVSHDQAITADHCNDATTLTISSRSGVFHFPIVEWSSHPIFDLAVVQFAADELPQDAVPLSALDANANAPLVGDLVEAAGYGLTERGTSGALNFSVHEIAAIEDDLALVLESEGSWLACAGDSGGPVLLRDERGRVRVAGVLSTGSFDCMGQGRYLYLPGFADWISDVVDEVDDSVETECGALTSAGRCFEQRAVHCEQDTLQVEDCRDGRICGWDIEQEGFRCISPDDDPCLGVPETGLCEDDVASRCAAGQLLALDCAPCGGHCDRSHETGLVGCHPG